MPKRVYQSPALGFLTGTLFLVGMLTLFGFGTKILLQTTEMLIEWVSNALSNGTSDYFYKSKIFATSCHFIPWILEVIIVETTFSLQLLCTIALQMAKFLERDQVDAARNQLSWLCSRDPSTLNKQELAAATLESLSVSVYLFGML